jgi:hypothetical protein
MSVPWEGGNMVRTFRVTFFGICVLSTCYFQAYAAQHYQHYQDIIIDNVVVQKGLDDCQSLYEVLKPILNRYKRPITVLDLGAGYGYFSFRIAREYDSTCVMIEDGNGSLPTAQKLLDLCHANAQLHNIILLDKKMSLQELEKLADCEHFDVVLAFDYIDHKAADWMQATDALLRMGDNIFIRASRSGILSKKASNKVIEYLVTRSGKLISQSPCVYDQTMREHLLWFECKKSGLRSKYFTKKSHASNVDVFHIDSSYTHKTFLKQGSTRVEWKKGINLMTFLFLHGAYPTRDVIKQAVTAHAGEHLTDFAPWNVIVQGENVVVIDQKDKNYRAKVSKNLKFMEEFIDLQSVQDLSNCLPYYKRMRTKKSWL